MTISANDKRVLYQRSGNRCAFPGCSKTLTFDEERAHSPTSLSEIAHIVAKSPDGPRGKYRLPQEQRDNYENLILLCEEHHHIIDQNPASYPVEMLRRWKDEHEQLVAQATGVVLAQRQAQVEESAHVSEVVHSTLLPVLHMPRYIYAAPCRFGQNQIGAAKAQVVHHSRDIAPFIIKEGRLICFNDLHAPDNPFVKLISYPSQVKRYETQDWWDDPDYERWFVELLNLSLNKLTGRKGLNWDRRHRRYFFQPEAAGHPLEVTYQPLNQAKATKSVVWEPKSRKTGEGRGYWLHLAVGLKFHQVSPVQWCLSIRPEMHVSKDGITPYPSEKIGSRITRSLSRRFNYDLLGNIQFWRAFLSNGSPRILLRYGYRPQYIEISTTLMETEVLWPGMPEEHSKSFKNVELPETLFSWAEMSGLDEDEWEYDDDEDEFEEEDE